MTAILLFFGTILRKLFKKGTFEEYSVSLNDEKFTTYIERFIKRQKLPQTGGAISDLASCKTRINKTYKFLSKKAMKGDLYEFEKWLYENHYFISNFFGVDLSDLPQIDGVPRIVLLAREILKVSAYKYNDKRVKEAIYLQNTVNPLTYDEICNLQNAFSFAYIEKIAIVSEKAALIGELEKLAYKNRRRFNKYLKSNFVRYFTAGNDGTKTDEEIVYAVNSVIVELTKVVTETLTGLREVGATDFSECYLPNRLLKSEPLYNKMTPETQNAYKKKIQELSDKLNVNEMSFTEKLLTLAKTEHVHFGEYLFEQSDVLLNYVKSGKIISHKDCTKIKKRAFVFTYFFLTVSLSVIIGYLSYAFSGAIINVFADDLLHKFVLQNQVVLKIINAVVMAFLSLFAVNRFVLKLLLAVSSVFSKVRPIFKMAECGGKTLVVVSQYISDEKQFQEAYEKFSVLKNTSVSDKLCYAMLVDLPKSAEETTDLDKKIIELCKSHDEIFLRKKAYNGKVYSAKERKRGAIGDLNEALISGNFKKFYVRPTWIEKPDYVVVLDDDSMLAPSAILKAVSEMEHPLNRKFDLMSFGAKYNLYSLKTSYSKRFISCAGVDYNAASSFYFNNFDEAIFCGKGIYRLEQFYKKLICRIPEGKVLSHDVIEGGFLNTAQSSVYVYEDAPLNKESDDERKIRWTRGDLLNFSFVFNKDINLITRLILFDLALKPFSESALFLMAVWSLFTLSLSNIILTLSILILPNVINIFAYFSNATNLRIEKKAIFLLEEIFDFFESLLLIVEKGVTSIMLSFSTFFKIIGKKDLLTWKTFYQSQKSGGKLVCSAVPTVIFCTIVGIAGYFISAFILLTLFFYLAFYVILYVFYNASNQKDVPKTLSDKQKETLEKWGKQTYKYFDAFMVNGLPCDNFQEFAGIGKAMRTSPTNIGFSLLSHVSANYLGYISYEDAEKRIEKTVLAIERLEKWNGNLYNWYDVESEKKLNGFVSSVDSGNFLSCLIVVKNFLKAGELKFKVNKIINDTRIGKLFDKRKNQFFIGYNAENGNAEGHYDLISSEAKLTILTAIALGEIDADAFYGVSRRSSDGITLSWSGTAFEYLMPELFLKSTKGSLYHYIKNKVVAKQIKSKCSGYWGISESGYADVIDNVFQYFAFGLNNLSLRSRRNECVISPYSSFLALCSKPEAAIKNLEKLEKIAFSCYGFYEAVDFSKGQTVSSYMAHHQGMSMASIANAVKDNIIVELYNDDDRIKAVSMLLTEPEICEKGESLKREKFAYSVYTETPLERVITKKYIEPKMNGHFGKYSVVLDDLGEGYSYCDGTYITRFRRHHDLPYGAFIIAENVEGDRFSPTFCPLKKFDDFEVVFKRNKSVFLNKTNKAKMTVITNPLFNGELRRFEFETSDKLKFAFYADLALNDFDTESSHTAFSDLMVKTELLGKDLILASRYDSERCAGLLIKGAFFTPVTKKTDFFENVRHNFAEINIDRLMQLGNSLGDVINPMLGCAFECEPINGKIVFDLVMCYGKEREELLKFVSRARSASFSDFMLTEVKRDEISENALLFTQTILPKLLFKEYSTAKLRKYSSEDGRYFSAKYLYYKFTGDLSQLRELGLVADCLKRAGVNTGLVVGYYEDDNYYMPIKNMLKKVAPNALFVDKNHSDWQEKSFMQLNDLTVVTNEQFILKTPALKKIKSDDLHCELSSNVLKSGEGEFVEEGYLLRVNQSTKLPYSNVVCSENGGFISTNNGTAFSYLNNSRLGRMTKFIQDGATAPSCERLCVLWKDKWANLYESNYIVKPEITKRFFVNELLNCEISEYVYQNGEFKITEIDIKKIVGDAKLLMTVDVSLGDELPYFLTSKVSGECVYFTNVKNGQKRAFRAIGGKADSNKSKYECRLFEFPFPTGSRETDAGALLEVNVYSGGKFYFVSGNINGIESITEDDLSAAKIKAENYKPPFELESPNLALNKLFAFLPIQVQDSRFYGRCGYYQTGGAIGFRDQLQDSICQMFTDKSAVRSLILDCAAHQYAEGDVQHWWHEPKHGVRTKITDDRLFLPFVTAIYIKYTGDYSILFEEIEYLTSPLLDGKSRYEIPQSTEYKESLLKHIKKAINSALDFGPNGLLKIKGGDWNDALDEVGDDEKGESVWLTEFMVLTLEMIKEFYESDSKIQIIGTVKKLKESIEKTFHEDRYARLVTKNDEWFGVRGGVVEIDVISQAFAALIHLDKQRVEKALHSALTLFDERNKIVALLNPPITKTGYGYISKYPPGVRENGGQYTHAAVWLALGFLEFGDCETAYKLLKTINPVERLTDKKLNALYMGEPYVLAGDVYNNKNNLGRMGWSWYTGSAAWYYVSVLKIYGIEINDNNLILKPNLPIELDGSVLKFSCNNSRIKIIYHKSKEQKMKVNNVFYEGVDAIKILPDKDYEIELFCK